MQKYSSLALVVVAVVAVAAFGVSTFNLSQQQAAAVTSYTPITAATKLTTQTALSDVTYYDTKNPDSFASLTGKDLPTINSCVSDYKGCAQQAQVNYNSCMGIRITPGGYLTIGNPGSAARCNTQRDYELRQCSNQLFECLMPLINLP